MNRLPALTKIVAIAVLGAGLLQPAWAEDKVWTIKSNDTLGRIIAEAYPGYVNSPVIMQELLKRSPDAFVRGDINRLIVGKSITLPAIEDIPGLQAASPETAASGTENTEVRMTELQSRLDAMQETVKRLEEENTSLQGKVKDYETEQQSKTTVLKELESKLETLTQDADKARTELADSRQQNAVLRNNVQQAQAAAVAAESRKSSRLPWLLLGLLTLVTLPLLWLLWQKREQPLLAGPRVAAPVSVQQVPVVARQPVVTPSPVVKQDDTAGFKTPDMPMMPVKAGASLPAEQDKADDDNPDADLKLDIARAYMELRDPEAAADMLQDVLVEGGGRQRQEAREILSFLS